MNNFSTNFKALRLSHGLTKESIAKYLSLSVKTIEKYESSKQDISLIHLEKLANLFGIEAYDLLEKEGVNQQISKSLDFSNFTFEDMNGVAAFHKIVNNYLKMKVLRNGNLRKL